MQDTEHVLRVPQGPPMPGNNGTLVFTGSAGGRRLTVVVSADRGTLVTAYWSGD